MVEIRLVRAASWFARAHRCAALLLLAACAQGGGPQSACTDCPPDAPTLGFSGGKASFDAHVRVVDASGKALEKARVEVGERSAMTDAKGRATIKNVDARSAATLKVSSDKGAPHFARTDAFKSGQTTHNVTLQPFALKAKVDLDEPLVVQKDFGRLSLPESAIAFADGRRAKQADLEVADLLAGTSGREAAQRFKAVDRHGEASLVKRIDAMGHVRFSVQGEELDLAPTKSALLELKLPDDSDAAPGDKRSLWSLDQKTFELHEESECVVQEQELAGQKRARVCAGHVSHFSVWAVASAAPSAPTLGCLDVRPALAEDACFAVEIERLFLLACDADGERCSETDFRDARLSAGAAGAPAYCGVLDASPSYRAAVLYDADASACTGDARGKSGRRIKLSEPLSSGAGRGLELLRAFAEDAQAACQSSCDMLALSIDEDDLAAEPLLDRDNDGHYAAGDGALFPGRPADCDDADPATYPGAPELFCGEVDRDCDGQAPRAARSPAELMDDARWNAGCALCADALEPADEVSGNLVDEDCDGQADDRDGDGALAPADCDDSSPAVAPDLSELPGNPRDEDCDGVALDWDGDGMPSPSHLYLAEAAGLDAALFRDCDDFDGAVYPDAPGAESSCQIEASSGGCPSFPWSGATVQTQCEETLDDGQATGHGVCVFGGWSDGNPLSLVPGELWGPCDDGRALPRCGPDAQCGGPLPYSVEVAAYLEATYTRGAALAFLGMCFPKCEL